MVDTMNKLSRTWRPGARASVMAGLACASLVCSLAMPPALVAMAQTTSSTSSPAPSQAAAADTADQSTTAPSTPNADVTADGTGGDATSGNSTGGSDSDNTAAPADPTDPATPGTATDSTADDATTPATPEDNADPDAPTEETPAPDNDRAALDALAAQHAAAVADGTYAIASSASQAANQRGVLDVQGASAAGGATIQLYASNGTGAQRWRVTHDDAGYVTFINVASGLALDVQRGNSAAGTPVQQYTPNGSWSQKWIVISLDEESGSDTTATAFPTRCIIVSALAPNIALDLRGGSIASTTPVQIWGSNHSAAQTFTFIDASPAAPAAVEDGTLPQGWFSLKPQCAPASGVDIYNASRNNNANAQLWSTNGTFAQLFTFKYCNGYYLIVNAASGKALDVEMADVVPGTNVQQYQASEVNPAQLWAPVANADGSYTFINKATGMALNIDGAASYNGANVNAYTPNGSAAQRFTLAKQTNLLAEGIYTLGASAATNSVLEVSGASQAAGASVQAYASNGTLAQRWRIALVPEAENTYTIQNLGSAKFLTADSAGTVSQRAASGAASGATAGTATGTSAAAGATAANPAQQWTPVITAHGIAFESVAHPGRVLDLTAGSTANGTRLQLWQANGSPAQAFALASTTDTLPNGTYTLTVANTSLAIDVANASYASGANVQVFQSNNSGAQKWNVARNADGTYTIVNAASGKALDVAGGSAYSGANVQQYQPNGSAAQRWIITFDAGGYKIASAAGAGGACVLDVSGGITSNGSAANGGNLQVYQSNNSAAQRFTLQPTTYVPPMPPTQLSMYTRAQGRFSATNCLIMVDTTNCRVGIFSGGMGYWNMDAYWTCSTGKPSTPTVVGEFTVTGKGYSFGENHGYSCYYYTQFYGDYLIHSIQYYANSFRVMDGRLGVHVSNGCVRMSIDQAKWIYDNIPYGTKVVTYR